MCRDLRKSRSLRLVTGMPRRTGGGYSVGLHGPDRRFSRPHGGQYFQHLPDGPGVLVFADPDNGFEPHKSCSDRHLAYTEVEQILAQILDQSMLSVFHHFRRVRFGEDFAHIRRRLANRSTTAVYWHSVMFVAISRSERTIERVRSFNRDYAFCRPVRAIP